MINFYNGSHGGEGDDHHGFPIISITGGANGVVDEGVRHFFREHERGSANMRGAART